MERGASVRIHQLNYNNYIQVNYDKCCLKKFDGILLWNKLYYIDGEKAQIFFNLQKNSINGKTIIQLKQNI